MCVWKKSLDLYIALFNDSKEEIIFEVPKFVICFKYILKPNFNLLML